MSTRVDWRDMARMPWDLFSASMDWFCRSAMPPGTYERRYHDDNNRTSQMRNDDYTTTYSRENYGQGRGWGEQFDRGADGSLSGDDVKLVSYKLVFTKPGREKVLSSGEDLINYCTDNSTYSGLKIARYLERNSEGIAEDDHRFLRVHIDVVKRFAKEREDYDRKRVDLMEREVEILSAMEKEIAAGNHRRAA